jgi:hypothetical protein
VFREAFRSERRNCTNRPMVPQGSVSVPFQKGKYFCNTALTGYQESMVSEA